MKTLLVIDDDSTILKLFEAFLGRAGYRVVTALSGDLGLAAFREHTPDAVICDLRMPGRGGLAVLAEIRALAPYTPFVVMSGTTDIGEATQALKQGAWDFLLKPFPSLEIIPPILARLAERAELLLQKEQYQARLETEIAERTSELTRQLYEKDQLLAEVHHRVKNNLQIILILLGLERENATQPETISVLAESQNRLHTLALIQDEIHDPSNTSTIASASFFANLIRHSLQVFGLDLDLTLDLADIALPPSTAFTYGLVVNELMTALSHARQQTAGNLTFRFEALLGGGHRLGLIAQVGKHDRDMMEALVGQGGGVLSYVDSPPSVVMTFP
jgi:DNA-binding response OmpR family regulator